MWNDQKQQFYHSTAKVPASRWMDMRRGAHWRWWIPGRLLDQEESLDGFCSDRLAGVFTKISNASLSQSFIPPCLKSAAVVPIIKQRHQQRNWLNLYPICFHGWTVCGQGVQLQAPGGVCTVDEDLQQGSNTSVVVKKAQQHLYFLRILERLNLEKKRLRVYYHCSVESILTYCTVSVCGSPAAPKHTKRSYRGSLTRTRRSPDTICPPDLCSTCCLRRAYSIIKDRTYPGHWMFELLPFGRCYSQSNQKQTAWGILFITVLYPC